MKHGKPDRHDAGASIDCIAGYAHDLSKTIAEDRHEQFRLGARQAPRIFGTAEVADILGISRNYVRFLRIVSESDVVEPDSRGSYRYSSQDIWKLRLFLAEGERKRRKFLPGRGPGDRLQTICVFRPNAGSATITSLTLGHGLALAGYKVLLVDFDAEGFMTSMCGYRPGFDFVDGGTFHDAIRHQDPAPLQAVIRNTSWQNVDLVPGGPSLSALATEALVPHDGHSSLSLHQRIAKAIEAADADYDVVIMDCPRQVGAIALGAMMAGTGTIIPVQPNREDVASLRSFLQIMKRHLNTAREDDGHIEQDFLRFLVYDLEPTDVEHNEMTAVLRQSIGQDVMIAMMLRSRLLSDAVLARRSMFEVDPASCPPQEYGRTMQPIRDVLKEVEAMIQASWGRTVS